MFTAGDGRLDFSAIALIPAHIMPLAQSSRTCHLRASFETARQIRNSIYVHATFFFYDLTPALPYTHLTQVIENRRVVFVVVEFADRYGALSGFIPPADVRIMFGPYRTTESFLHIKNLSDYAVSERMMVLRFLL